MAEEAQELLDSLGYDEWVVDSECTLISPNGHCIEWDGISPDGEVSPMVMLGMI